MLAGLVRAPSQLAPTRNFGGAKERADIVLQTMVETGAITAAEADKARAETITLRTPPETPPGTNYFSTWCRRTPSICRTRPATSRCAPP